MLRAILPLLVLVGTCATGLAGDLDVAPPVWRILRGETRHVVRKGETAATIARRFSMTQAALAELNPETPLARVRIGTRLRVVDRHIVPAPARDGIVVDLAERVLFWLEGGNLKARYPIAAGKPGWPTPTGAFWISGRRKNPTWHVPPSIQREMARAGDEVVTAVPPGPDNPLGRHFIQLSAANVGFHGTNAPSSIGRFTTHGCMRMLAADVERLFNDAPDYTPVQIVYEPLQLATDDDGRVYMEVHRDVYRRRRLDLDRVRTRVESAGLAERVDLTRAASALRTAAGTVLDVTARGTVEAARTPNDRLARAPAAAPPAPAPPPAD